MGSLGCPNRNSPGHDPWALRGRAPEVPLAEAGPHPGRCWKPWETASIHAVDTKSKGRHPDKALSTAFVRTAPPVRHADGNGLYLFV